MSSKVRYQDNCRYILNDVFYSDYYTTNNVNYAFVSDLDEVQEN